MTRRLLVAAAVGVAGMTLLLPAAAGGQSVPTLSLRESLRIGSVDRENYALTYVNGIAIADDGTIYVAQSMDGHIKAFGPRGEFIRRLGSKGSGPGEFRAIETIAWTRRGLFVYDPASLRATLLDSRGRAVRIWGQAQHDYGAQFLARAPLYALDNGMLLTVPLTYSSESVAGIGVPVAAVDSSGRYRGEVVRLTAGDLTKKITDRTGWVMHVPLPTSTATLYAALPAENALLTVERSRTAQTAGFTIRKYRTDGTTILARSYTVPVVPVTRTIVDAEVAAKAAVLFKHRGEYISRDAADRMFSAAYAGITHQAPVDEVVAGRDGAIWLRRGSFGMKTVEWILFGSRGEMKGRLLMPMTSYVLYGTGSTLWTVELDEYDVSYVVRYDVSGLSPAKSSTR